MHLAAQSLLSRHAFTARSAGCHLQQVGIVVRFAFEPGRLAGPCAGVEDLDERIWRWQARVKRSGDLFEARMPRAELIFPHMDDAEGPCAG